MKDADVKLGNTYLLKVAGNLVPVKIGRKHSKGGWEGISAKTGKVVRIAAAARLQEAPGSDGRKAAPKANAQKKAKRLSGLDAAVMVLKEAGKPMTAGGIVQRMLSKDLWRTSGKTPAATIYAAMVREIQTKTTRSRFRRARNAEGGVDKGLFELTDRKDS